MPSRSKRPQKRTRRSSPRRPATPVPRIEGTSVVLLGSFNPAIFQPAWMAAQGFLEDQEADDAQIRIIHPDIVSFTASAISIEVSRDRFQSESVDATAFERLRDNVLGIFGRLAHTPVRAMGINHSSHIEMPTQARWNALGHRIVPPDNWTAVLGRPGMRTVTVEGVRPDDYQGFIHVQVEPSVRIRHGVFVAVNDHIQLTASGNDVSGSDAMSVLGDVWPAAVERARTIVQHVVSLA